MPGMRLTFQHNVRAKPAWVIMGIERDDGTVMLVASEKLRYADLEAKMDDLADEGFWNPKVRIMPNTRYELRGELDEIVYVVAGTWFDAFAKLFGLWEPPTPRLPQLPAQTD